MADLEFISSIVSSLAWPVTIVALALLFRRSLGRLLSGRVRRWRAGPTGFEVEYWDEVADEARASLPEKPPPAEVVPKPVGPPLRQELEALAQDRPPEAIVEAFRRVEQVLRRRVEPLVPEVARAPSATAIAGIAATHGIIDAPLLSTIEGLAVLRNLAVHTTSARELSPGKAMEFLDLADAAIYAIGRSGSA